MAESEEKSEGFFGDSAVKLIEVCELDVLNGVWNAWECVGKVDELPVIGQLVVLAAEETGGYLKHGSGTAGNFIICY